MEKQEIIEKLEALIKQCEAQSIEFKKAEMGTSEYCSSAMVIAYKNSLELMKSLTPPKQDEPERGITINHVGKVSAEEVLKQQQRALAEYVKMKHTQEECIGFVDGYECAVKFMHTYASQVNAEISHLANVLNINQPLSLESMIDRLVSATNYLLHWKGYDGGDYEEMGWAVDVSKELIPKIQEAHKHLIGLPSQVNAEANSEAMKENAIEFGKFINRNGFYRNASQTNMLWITDTNEHYPNLYTSDELYNIYLNNKEK